MNKDVQLLISEIKNQPGVTVEWGGKHVGVFRDGNRLATLPLSPSDSRWRKNIVKQLLRDGLLARDPWSGHTPAKKKETDVAKHPAVTDEQRDKVITVFNEVARNWDLQARDGRVVAHGTVPHLTDVVYAYVGFSGRDVPPVVRYGQIVDGYEATKFLCERLTDIYKGVEHAYQSTLDFVEIVWDAWDWFEQRGYMLDTTPPEVIDVEGVTYVQAETDVTIEKIDVPDDFWGGYDFSGEKSDMPKDRDEKADLAIRVAAAVGGADGVKLAREVMDL